jgi:hypothetical protein
MQTPKRMQNVQVTSYRQWQEWKQDVIRIMKFKTTSFSGLTNPHGIFGSQYFKLYLRAHGHPQIVILSKCSLSIDGSFHAAA